MEFYGIYAVIDGEEYLVEVHPTAEEAEKYLAHNIELGVLPSKEFFPIDYKIKKPDLYYLLNKILSKQWEEKSKSLFF